MDMALSVIGVPVGTSSLGVSVLRNHPTVMMQVGTFVNSAAVDSRLAHVKLAMTPTVFTATMTSVSDAIQQMGTSCLQVESARRMRMQLRVESATALSVKMGTTMMMAHAIHAVSFIITVVYVMPMDACYV